MMPPWAIERRIADLDRQIKASQEVATETLARLVSLEIMHRQEKL